MGFAGWDSSRQADTFLWRNAWDERMGRPGMRGHGSGFFDAVCLRSRSVSGGEQRRCRRALLLDPDGNGGVQAPHAVVQVLRVPGGAEPADEQIHAAADLEPGSWMMAPAIKKAP